MHTHILPDPVRFSRMTSEEMREAFLIERIFEPDRIDLVYVDLDRAIVGSAVPTHKPLLLDAGAALRADFFCQRRELGVLNIGGLGTVVADGTRHNLARLEAIYVGRGTRQVAFVSANPDQPARFYLVSFPAHADWPTTVLHETQAEVVTLGAAEQANRRTIHKLIHPAGVKSCQLVMGFTRLAPGSVWNTMPPHTHARRTEVYLYFDMPADSRVFHMMGPPDQTRHLVVADAQAVLSPNWSVHSGVGTSAYAFCWAMGGENQTFDDMDAVKIADLR